MNDDLRTDRLMLLEETENELRNALAKAKEEITTEQLRIAKEAFGAEIGAVVKNRDGEFRVTSVVVSRWWERKPSLEGNPKKKNGEFGVAVRHVYGDWELVSPAEPK